VQLAFLDGEPSRARRVRGGRDAGEPGPTRGLGSPPHEFAPIRLRPLPARIALAELTRPPGQFIVGVGGDGAEALSVDLFAGAARLLVAGPSRSGRSNALCTLFVQAVRDEIAVVVAAPPRSPLAGAAKAYGIAVISPDDAPAAVNLASTRRTMLLVDDSEAYLDTPVGDALGAAVRGAPDGLAAVVAGNSDDLPLTYRGAAAEVRRSRCALVLKPGPGDADLVGQRLPRRRGAQPAGRGLLVGESAWGAGFATAPIPIQVALP